MSEETAEEPAADEPEPFIPDNIREEARARATDLGIAMRIYRDHEGSWYIDHRGSSYPEFEHVATIMPWKLKAADLQQLIERLPIATMASVNKFLYSPSSEIRKLMRALVQDIKENKLPEPPKTWRCFHCDEVFTDEDAARLHFGSQPYNIDKAICTISVEDLRKLQEDLRECRGKLYNYENDDGPRDREITALESKHRQDRVRAEEDGYAKGIKVRVEELRESYSITPLPVDT